MVPGIGADAEATGLACVAAGGAGRRRGALGPEQLKGIMNSKPIRRAKKKLGRPKTTGAGERIGTRWQEPLLRSIDEWREAQNDEPSRAEAIRRLVVLGLSLERVVEKLLEAKRKD
jgi:hypothetical protein